MLTVHAAQVTWYENGTYPTNATAPPFTATWQYPQAAQDQPVHAFPNALVNFTDAVQASTIQIGNLSAMNVDVMWTYGTGPDVATQLDPVALDAAELNANVCIDTFLDSDPIKAQTTNSSQYEVMVWFGQFGLATDPIGFVQGVVETVTVNTTQLYVLPPILPICFMFHRVARDRPPNFLFEVWC